MGWGPFGPEVRTRGCGIVASAGIDQAQTIAQARVGDTAWEKRLNQPLPLGSQSYEDGPPEAGSGKLLTTVARGAVGVWAGVGGGGRSGVGEHWKEGMSGLRPEEGVAIRPVREENVYVRDGWLPAVLIGFSGSARAFGGCLRVERHPRLESGPGKQAGKHRGRGVRPTCGGTELPSTGRSSG